MKILTLTLFFALICSVGFAQKQAVTNLDTTLNNRWLALDKDWRYQKGDNKDWAKPDFDDASWKVSSNKNLNMPDGKNAIANRGEIVWVRLRLKADTTLTDALVLNIRQLGASEVYIDGKLIHQLGKVSSDINQIVYHNPHPKILQLPLTKGKEQVLAIRYVNAQYRFPIYASTNGYIRVLASTLGNANSSDPIKNSWIAGGQQFKNRYYIMAGMATLMFIIFLSFFLFFPSEKINAYFATGVTFITLFAFGVIESNDTTRVDYWFRFAYDTFNIIYVSISLYCLCNIFNRQIDSLFKGSCLLCLLSIVFLFLYSPDTIAQTNGIVQLILMTVLSIKSRKKNRVAGIIFVSSSFISVCYWTIIVLNGLGIIPLNLRDFVPIAFMINPISLAIYLGYAFGKRSQDLRLNLERVQTLSKEKEAILSFQNETLEQQVKERTFALNNSLDKLKSTQTQLIQSEKLASLGELTAGIAHEIQNPLNFVNNFSELSGELIDEMNEEIDNGNLEEVKAISGDLKQNLEKINTHGKRASSIVKGMLEHSRTSTGTKELTDINKLADEYLRLSYHGLRAKDSTFNSDFQTDFDENLPKIAAIPQDFGRVLLNLFNNAFYAVKTVEKPLVVVKSERFDNQIIIIVKDNGIGMSEATKAKIFQPFFTTKPTGQGTGLGLSLAYDIITKGHGGTLEVETKEGEGSIFTIKLPLNIV